MTDETMNDKPELRMSAYYYGFLKTGVREIDLILSAIACAGKAYHNTDQWDENTHPYHPDFKGNNPVEWIQNAANEAAQVLSRTPPKQSETVEGDVQTVLELLDDPLYIDFHSKEYAMIPASEIPLIHATLSNSKQSETVDENTSDGYHTFKELYEHRHILFFAVLAANPSKAWKSKLHDDGSFMEGWFIAGIETDLGQATYHLPLRMWGLFADVFEVEKAPKWDGHNSEDVLIRIREMAFSQPKQLETIEPVKPLDLARCLKHAHAAGASGIHWVDYQPESHAYPRIQAALSMPKQGDSK